MSRRILQNNHLYRRIQYRNIFQTFSKSYKKQSLSHIKDNQQNNNNTIEDGLISINKTINNFGKTKVRPIKNDNYTQRIQSQTSYPTLNTKFSTNLIQPQFEYQSKTTPINFDITNNISQSKVRRDCHTSMSSKNPQSETVLTKWNQKKKNQDFKLRSCLQKNKLKYECIIDQTQFSTLQVKKRSQILNKRENRYNQRWRFPVQRETSKEFLKQGQTTSSKGGFIISKYTRLGEGHKSNMQLLIRSRK